MYNFLYLIQEKRDLNRSIFKIGKTTQLPNKRLEGYPKDTIPIRISEIDNCHTRERELINLFKQKYKLIRGREYFLGNKINMIIDFNYFCDNISKNIIKNQDTINEEYKCKMCEQIFKSKNNLVKHTLKKNKCNIVTPFQCKKCNKYFKQNRSLINHTDKCNENIMNEIINSENCNYKGIKSIIISKDDENIKLILLKKYNPNMTDEELKIFLKSSISIDGKISLFYSMINSNKNSLSNINTGTINSGTIENSNNIINNIQINTFGKEDLSYLDNDYFKNLIMNQHIEKGYVQLIKDIYLNKEHPENGTIKVENLNNKYAHVYNNGKWDTILKYDLREQIHKKNYTILKMHYNKLKNAMSLPKKEETVVFLARDELSDPHMMYVIDKIILLFYNDGEGDDLIDKYKIGKNSI
jgi:hypothetical protein